jgi:hypothetical protein
MNVPPSMKLSLIMAVFLVSASGIVGQIRRAQHSSMVRLNANKPTVYVTYKDVVSGLDGRGFNEQLFRLELHNNTRWVIWCYLVPGPTSAGDSPIMYQVDAADGSRANPSAGNDVLIPKTLESGKSASFLVSAAHLAKGFRIFVEFNYEWEKRDQIAPYGVEPSHRVYFYHNDLPANLRKK